MAGETEKRRPPLRCRGVPLGDGQYAGCVYGSGEERVLMGDCDCPVCHGSGYEGMIATWIPHQDAGDPDCGGFLYGIIRGDEGYIECNDCDAIVRRVPADELQRMLNEMESALEVASEQCPYCGKCRGDMVRAVCEVHLKSMTDVDVDLAEL